MVDSTNLPDVDINQIATDLNGKMDRDCLNASDTGNIQMAKASMPSDRYIDLSLGASRSTYTAPADGWFCAQGNGTSNNMWIELDTQNNGIKNGIYGTVTWNYKISLPVRKGAVVKLNYNNINFNFFRFHYAVGSESEAL